MAYQFDTWVAKYLDVATVRDDHYPAVLELVWQPRQHVVATQWLTPIMDRSLMKEPELMKGFQSSLSKLLVPELSTPVDAFHSYIIRKLQALGSCWFPLPDAAPHRDWISGDTWLHMNLLGVWRKQRAKTSDWGRAL